MPTRELGERDLELLKDVLDSGVLGSLKEDRMVARFGREFAAAIGARHGVAMNAGMSALHAGVLASGARAGDEVICDPVVIFGSMAAMYAGAVPIYADVDADSWNINPDTIEACITERTKAIIVTHMCGLPAEMGRVMEVARRHRLFVIEDCAHAMLATYRGQCVGTWGDVGAFSFQESKQLSLGDGGMAVMNSEEAFREVSLHGSKPTFRSVGYGLHYNYRMTEVVAAMGIAQLERMPSYISGFQAVVRAYTEGIAGIPWLVPQTGPAESVNTHHLWGCRFDGEQRGIAKAEFERVLTDEQCGIGFYTGMPAYRHPVMAQRVAHALDCPSYTGTQNRYPEGTCPIAETLAPRIMLAGTWVTVEQAKAEAERLRRAAERLG